VNRIVICGHSLGCVNALYTAKIIKNNDRHFFIKKCFIIGSAPFKTNDLKLLYDMPNVKIFAYCEIIDNVAKIDCFLEKGYDGIKYKSIQYFTTINNNGYELIHDITMYNIELFNDTDRMSINNNYTECQVSHRWENYYNGLSQIYKYNEQQDKITSKLGGKSIKYNKKSKLRRKTRKYNKS
jgi:hypothetical protein